MQFVETTTMMRRKIRSNEAAGLAIDPDGF
jgi:hypothetical protein